MAWLIEGQHRGLLGFALLWLLVAGLYLRIYAQFLRWWHRLDYSAVWPKARTSSDAFMKDRRLRRNAQDGSLADLEKRLLAAGGRA
jgi:hypothetical protein